MPWLFLHRAERKSLVCVADNYAYRLHILDVLPLRKQVEGGQEVVNQAEMDAIFSSK
ncbi:hypothetical protein I3843_05G091100 [Carya illinoinensis]|nr:hypothetical protein I3843_05G091100 [Carya illinoinensis]